MEDAYIVVSYKLVSGYTRFSVALRSDPEIGIATYGIATFCENEEVAKDYCEAMNMARRNRLNNEYKK